MKKIKNNILSGSFLCLLFSGISLMINIPGYAQQVGPQDDLIQDAQQDYKLCSFKVKYFDGKAYATWVVVEPSEKSFYVLERSTDNIHFEPIYTKKGALSINKIELMHCYTDESPITGASYYRVTRITGEENQVSDALTFHNSVIGSLSLAK
jgi:hypothetical protein